MTSEARAGGEWTMLVQTILVRGAPPGAARGSSNLIDKH